ncbi:MAG: hypothetical protein LBS86_00415 [Treponema sp.]|nr:hypothetical protein [Treponema sp.]
MRYSSRLDAVAEPVEATILTVFSVGAAPSTGSAAGSTSSVTTNLATALRRTVAALRQAQ